MPDHLCIFFVDDDADDRELIHECFTLLPSICKVKIFASGADMLNELSALDKKEYPSLVVLDYNMPKMSGLEVLQNLKAAQRFHNIPVIFFTTSCSPELEKSALNHGALLCLQKATSYKDLLDQVRGFEEMAVQYSPLERKQTERNPGRPGNR